MSEKKTTISFEQRKAADPKNSVWVSANAGSGKTSVLTSRVVRLLLAGANPASILCVTFTKAAAANMQDRIFKRLGEWVALDDTALSEAIEELTGEAPRRGDLAKARKLFAQAVETPGGLKIQTIHGFCEKLLHQFPFEAAVPARFEVLDDVQQSALTENAITSTLNEALAAPGGLLGRALATATAAAGEDGFREALRAFMQHRRDMPAPTLEVKFAGSGVRSRLGITQDETTATAKQAILEKGLYAGNWQEIVGWLNAGSGNDIKLGKRLFAAHKPQGDIDCEAYVRVFLTDDDLPRKTLATNKTAEARPDLLEIMQAEQERVFDLWNHAKDVAAAERTEAIILLADSILARYRSEKRRMGRLDFADLIGKVVQLLKNDTARWVLYKLDQGLDHVLVDEAQDTSPEQWSIIKAIADDFFAGAGARNLFQRTIFAVGDEKQSIFGFQGAKPEEFDKARKHFQTVITDYNKNSDTAHGFADVPLQTSYRTVGDVLSAVDQVFSLEANYKGIDSRHQKTVHSSNRMGDPGLVELWPPIVGEKVEKTDAADPVDAVPDEAPSRKLARRIAARIAFWRTAQARFENDGKLITPGDILVLVRNRGAVFDGVIKALKEQDIPVAGADRMKLKEQIAVLDLLALGRFCLLPEDDLTLACVLKSPLIGLDDNDLIRLASKRGGISLWQSLRDKAADEARYALALQRLARWQAIALKTDPYAFYMHCLSVDGGRKKLVSRIGIDAEEAITVFLSQLRQWQASNPPSLLGFIEAMEASETDVKRDMEEAHGRVRVMTVHASKGLEARVVFLADLFHKPEGKNTSRLIELELDDPFSAIWSPNKGADSPKLVTAKERVTEAARAESRRLLYVALTRARDRLYLAGAHGTKAPPKENWHDLVEGALSGQPEMKEIADETGDGVVLRWTSVPRKSVPPETDTTPPDVARLPDWLFKKVPDVLPRPPPLRPSRIADAAEPPAIRDGVTARAQARLRGDLIHLLLQYLPDVSGERRSVVAQELSAARFPSLDRFIRDEAIKSTLQLISNPTFAGLFSGNARAEVDIAGRIDVDGKKLEVAGRIDRLAITQNEVMLVDYKTGRAPRDPQDVPQSHLTQLAVYEELLRDLYPDKTITTAIVWTAIPAVIILDNTALKSARNQIKVA